jgi:hypothetical protein
MMFARDLNITPCIELGEQLLETRRTVADHLDTRSIQKSNGSNGYSSNAGSQPQEPELINGADVILIEAEDVADESDPSVTPDKEHKIAPELAEKLGRAFGRGTEFRNEGTYIRIYDVRCGKGELLAILDQETRTFQSKMPSVLSRCIQEFEGYQLKFNLNLGE